jgi:hypothetical protein
MVSAAAGALDLAGGCIAHDDHAGSKFSDERLFDLS